MMDNLFFVQIKPKGSDEYFLVPLASEFKDASTTEVLKACLDACNGNNEALYVKSALKELGRRGYIGTTGDEFIPKNEPVVDYVTRGKIKVEGQQCYADFLYLSPGEKKKVKKAMEKETLEQKVKSSRARPSRKKEPFFSKKTKNTFKAAGFILYTGFMMYCMNRCDSVYYKHKYEHTDSTGIYDTLGTKKSEGTLERKVIR